MPVKLIDKGKHNVLELHPWFEKAGGLRVEFQGDNNRLCIMEEPKNCTDTHIQLGSNSTVSVGKACWLSNTFIHTEQSGHVVIGERSSFTARARFIMHEPSRVTIGRDCMIASDVQFMTSDAHTIYECSSGRRLNDAEDIDVGDHVWIALQTFVLKGAKIGAFSIVGMRSVVTGELPANCLAAGTPAKVLREGVSWDRRLWEASEQRLRS